MKKFQAIIRQFMLDKKQIGFLSAFVIGVLGFGIFFVTNTNSASSENAWLSERVRQSIITGEWVADFRPDKPDGITLTFMRTAAKDGVRQAGDTYFLDELQGLAPGAASAKTNVIFQIVREAGTFVCEGYFSNGKGRGSWTLTPNKSFVSAMRSRGYDNLSENDLFHAAYGKTSIKLVDDLKSAGYDRLPMDELVAAGIFKVNSEFIRMWRSAGFNNLSFDELIQLGTFKVTPEFLNEIKAEGFPQISPSSAVELKAHKIDRDFIRRVKARGFPDVTLDEIIELRIHKMLNNR